MVKKYLWGRMLAVTLIIWALPLVVGALGGMLLFSHDATWVRGIGLALIVLIPWLLTELLKERPTPPQRRR